ncbi:MAG: TonB family protein [Pseudomonadota bacterium]
MSKTDDLHDTLLGDLSRGAPSVRLWIWGGVIALVIHLAVALPFLPKPAPDSEAELGLKEGPPLGVRLAPIIAPPEPIEQPPVIEEPEPKLEERASDSPPPAPPAKPRELPDLPDIRPQSVPDLWLGGSSGGGTLTLEEYLALQEWLRQARAAVIGELGYPSEARRNGMSGEAEIIIVVNREGRILDWSYVRRTGYPILDREIEDTVRRVRRLPRFPEGTPYETLSYRLTIRFELMYASGDRARGAPPPRRSTDGDPNAGAQPQATLSSEDMSRCAASAAELSVERDAILARRAELEAQVAEFERQIARYERRGENLPRSLRRDMAQYEDAIAAFDAEVGAFQSRAQGFSAVCGGGSARFEEYAQACAPYATTGNSYCEAFADLWTRLAR